jgi:hypothetical protein
MSLVTAVVGVLLLLSVLLFVLYTLYVYKLKKSSYYALIPSPKGAWFYFGHVPLVASKLKKGTSFDEIVSEWQAECGLFLLIWKFNTPEIIHSHPESVKSIALERFPKEDWTFLVNSWRKQRFLGRSILTITEYSKWKNIRRHFNPAFAKKLSLILIKYLLFLLII